MDTHIFRNKNFIGPGVELTPGPFLYFGIEPCMIPVFRMIYMENRSFKIVELTPLINEEHIRNTSGKEKVLFKII